MLHAATILPLAMLAMTTGMPAGLASSPAHGGEMLAGYALAVMAGFLLPPLTKKQAVGLIGLWLMGRIAIVSGWPALWVIIPNVAFATAMTVLIVPRFTGAAKKLRNQATAPLVALIAACVSAAVVLVASNMLTTARPVLYAAVTLLAGLLLFMGGRVLAPVAIGALQKRGFKPTARVQPRFEGAILLSFIPAVAAQAAAILHPIAAVGTGTAGILGLIRLGRWRLWRGGRRPDLWGLGLGYAWVCIGLILLGAHWLGVPVAAVLGLHVITIGGLGTLSLNVMARTWLVRAQQNPARSTALAMGSVLITLAVLLRAAAISLSMLALNQVAAAAWALAFAVVLISLSHRAPTWVENQSHNK